jgi:hypothetical protein
MQKKKRITNPSAGSAGVPEGSDVCGILYKIEEMERRILQEIAKSQKNSGDLGIVLLVRMLSRILIPARAFSWVICALLHPISSLRIIRDWIYIKKSRLFDDVFYASEYPDVMMTAVNPLFHYCMKGWREMRNPRPDFVTAAYLERNPDIKLSGMNPFYHYVRYRGVEPHREGTAKPLKDTLPGEAQQVYTVKPIALEIKKVPAPLTGKTLVRDYLLSIAATVRDGLYEEKA